MSLKTSESYKHLKTLRDTGFVSKNNKKCSLTKKGLVALESLEEMMNSEPKILKLMLKF